MKYHKVFPFLMPARKSFFQKTLLEILFSKTHSRYTEIEFVLNYLV